MIDKIIIKAIDEKASDIHLTVGSSPVIRVNGELVELGSEKMTAGISEKIVEDLLSEEQMKHLHENGEIDFSFTYKQIARLRANIFIQKSQYAIALRLIPSDIPSIETLELPEVIKNLANKKSGLVLVTGPTGSGKSTTLAAIIDFINSNKRCHILTLEDPIEYLHPHKKSIINQREIGHDTNSYANALRAAMRQDPDVILIGELRDLDTIATAITAAETGHLVLATLHTTGAIDSVNRIIDVFPAGQQQQIRLQLSAVLRGVVSQQLIPNIKDNKRELALEIMIRTIGVGNLIREGKTPQIVTSIETGAKLGMITMEKSLNQLVDAGKISKDTLKEYIAEAY